MNSIDRLIEAVEAGEPERHVDLLHVITGKSGIVVLALDAFNGSLDAALALHEALLPGWRFDIASEANGLGYVANVSDPAWCHTILADATTPARSLLLAILRAYRSVQA